MFSKLHKTHVHLKHFLMINHIYVASNFASNFLTYAYKTRLGFLVAFNGIPHHPH